MLLPENNQEDAYWFPFRAQFFPPLLVGADICALTMLCWCTDLVTFC